MESVKKIWPIVIVLFCCLSIHSALAKSDDGKKLDRTKVEYYQSDNITNQVPYFDNRFRIDAELEEITLIFYRKSGSTPIILIRPDGSKIRVNNIDYDKVQWYDDRTFDMIKIKKPMPGPWQAVGDILPNSQILVVSDIKIAVEPLPEIVFSGETLKVEGKLFNGEKAIDSPYFQDVVKLDVNFYSTNNSVYENFGADAIKIASFRDDGRGLDEYKNDSVFTGEFVLDFAAGEWQPVYLVKLPMGTRELRQQPIILHKPPVSLQIEMSSTADTPHKMNIIIDPSLVDVDSLVFQGKITLPDKQVSPFSIMEGKGEIRIKDIAYTESGIHRINLSAFGKTIKGREFRLVVPEVTFFVNAAENILLPTLDEKANDLADVVEDNSKVEMEQENLIALVEEQESKDMETIIIIAAGNAVIIIFALVLFFVMRKKKGKVNQNKN